MQKVIITSNDYGKRIDKFLIAYYNLPPSLVMRKFRLKDIRLNGKKISNQKYLLEIGDEIITYFKQIDKGKKLSFSNKKLDVIYKDKNILLIKKPVYTLVNGDPGNDIVSMLNTYLKENRLLIENSSYHPAPIHQLDKNTTGILITALNYQTHKTLSKVLSKPGFIQKYYRAKVIGNISKAKTLKNKLKHDEKTKKVIVDKKGKEAILELIPLQTFNNKTILDIKLITGRKHQIRVQVSNIGHPIVGDPKYGGPKDKYLNLCAYKIVFNNLENDLKYLNGKEFKIKLPTYLEK